MRRIIIITICFQIIQSICSLPTLGQNINPKLDNVQSTTEIIEKGRKIISQEVEIDSIYLEFNSTNLMTLKSGKIRQNTSETKIYINSLNQIRIEDFSDFTTNQQLNTEVFNAPKFSIASDVLVNGKPFYFGSNLSSIAPKFTKEQRIDSIRYKVFNAIFPMLLNSEWFNTLEFIYVGEAESKDFKAQVVEVSFKNNKSRLLFDKETHLPVLMIQTFIHPITKEETERKTYYTDYKEINGLFVAHKIIIQTGNNTTEERQLKKLEINPKFKANLFEIKEDKINPY